MEQRKEVYSLVPRNQSLNDVVEDLNNNGNNEDAEKRTQRLRIILLLAAVGVLILSNILMGYFLITSSKNHAKDRDVLETGRMLEPNPNISSLGSPPPCEPEEPPKHPDTIEESPSPSNIASNTSTYNAKLCESEICYKAGEDLKLNMDLSVDPCEDFYKYACGNYPLQPGQNDSSTFGLLDKRNSGLISEFLENPYRFPALDGSTANSPAVRKASDFYKSCVNQQSVDSMVMLTLLAKTITHINDTDDIEVDDFRFDKDFLKVDMDPLKHPSLLRPCLVLTRQLFPDITSRIFLSRLGYNSSVQRKVREIMGEMSDTLSALISKHVSWLGQRAKDFLLKRIEQTEHVVGYPQGLFMDAQLREVISYVLLDISRDPSEYYANLRKLLGQRKSFNVYYASLIDLLMSQVPMANAFYIISRSVIFLPAGITQPPFFHNGHGYPDLINYASLGTILGHEFAHAFEAHFRSVLNLPIEISSEDYTNMVGREQCVEDKYQRINLRSAEYLKFNVSRTHEENVADILGYQMAYQMTQKIWESEEYQRIRGLEGFTPQQIFFIAAVQTDCRAFKNEDIKRRIVKGEAMQHDHSPTPIRVFGALSNNDEFAKAFQCKVGSVYNPVSKCRFFE